MTTQAKTIITSAFNKTVGYALARPIGILVTIPLLVVALGVFITWTTWRNQSRLATDQAALIFSGASREVHEHLVDAVAGGDAVLEALRSHLDRRQGYIDAMAFAWEFRYKFADRPTLAYIGYGDEGGSYYGILPDDKGYLFTKRVRTTPDAKFARMDDFRYVGGKLISERIEKEFTYDPRQRPWYLSAVAHGGRITSAPYPWYDSGLVGVTIAEPYHDASGALRGVIEIDFNVNSLSALATEMQSRLNVLVMIVTDDGEVLAFPGMRQEAKRNQEGAGTVMRVADLQHPAVTAFFAADRHTALAKDVVGYQVENENWLAATRTLDLPGGRSWRVVSLGSLDERLAPAVANLWQSTLSVGLAVLFVCILSFLFARHLIRNHLRIRRAEKDAALAKAAVRSIGAYHLTRILGEGGMGEVWLGQHGLLARPVAVKLINSRYFNEMTLDERDLAIERFKREARTMASLRSPHTITVYDFGQSGDGDLFYAMEILDGMDLYDLVDTYGPQPLPRVVHLLRQAASSLAEAHQQGLVHRDIKPANIYLCRLPGELDVAKVLDFGMVRRVQTAEEQRLTMAGTVEGTPAYMAPEQIRNAADIDGRADLYALALVGYYLLTGQEPFTADTPMNSLLAHLEQPVPQLPETVLPSDHPMAQLLHQCMAKDPAERPIDLDAFASALMAMSIDHSTWSAGRCAAWWEAIPASDFTIDEDAFGAREMQRGATVA